MLDLDILDACGCSAEKWKAKLAVDYSEANQDEGLKNFRQRLRSRIQAGRLFNLENAKLWHALDLAWDSPFQQISPTLLASLADKTYQDGEEVTRVLKSWGMDLNEVLVQSPDPKTPNKSIFKVSVPAFFKIGVPLVAGYVTMRMAKIMNDRRLNPYFQCSPAFDDEATRFKADVVTHRIETMSRQMNYYESDKDACFKMLHYGEAFKFPMEEWYSEYQLFPQDSPYETASSEEDVEIDGVKYKKVTTKEGIRYHCPHPSRTYFDRSHPPSSFNTDTGCTYGGYWRILTYKEVRTTPGFYNLEKIGIGDTKEWQKGGMGYAYMEQIYPCSMTFPTVMNDTGTGRYDTETNISNQFYTSTMDDKAILLTEHWEKIIPSQCGLGKYDYPIWARFVCASHDTVVYAAPVPYSGPLYAGDAPSGRTLNASMSLQALPFQDQFTNLLTQFLLTVRQNLANLNMIDTDIVPEVDIKKLENWGERWWRGLNILRFSGRTSMRSQQNNSAAIVSHRFPNTDTTGLMNAMRQVLDILERVLVMSSQEVGQAASHEQTREEVRNISQNTSTRLTYSAAALDAMREAQKRQLYLGLMAYGDAKFYAQITMETPLTEEELKKIGFTYKKGTAWDPRTKKATIAVDRTTIAYESFASDRDGDDRINNGQTATEMIQFVQTILANPMIGQAIGPVQAIKICNFIGRLAGFPRDFKLVDATPPVSPEEQQAQQAAQMQQVKQYIDQVAKSLQGEVKQALTHVMDEMQQDAQGLQQIQQEVTQLAQQTQATEQTVQQIQQIQQAAMSAPPLPSPSLYDGTPPPIQGGSPPPMAVPIGMS